MEVTADGSQTPYEVFCPTCKVTFPVGTRRCIHCGQPLGGPPRERSRLLRPVPPHEAPEEDLPKKGMFSPMTVIWVLLLLGGALSRACSPS